jgi:DNA-binding PadR family transcriptional regulator
MRSTQHVADQGDAGHYSDPPLLVLASLAAGPRHGHAMLDDIEQMSGTRLGPGTLYGAISRLEAQGWIEPLPAEARRRPYRLTAAGHTAFAAKMATLRRFVAATEGRLAPA